MSETAPPPNDVEWANGGAIRPPALPPEREARPVRKAAGRPKTNGALRSVPVDSDGPPPADRRPTIRVTPELHLMIDASISALGRDPNLYERSGAFVYATDVPDPVDGGTIPIVKIMPIATVRERMTCAARYEQAKVTEEGLRYVQVVPNNNIVSGVHARGGGVGIRTLVGIIESPTLRPDGSLLVAPGYDAQTRLLYQPSIEFPVIPDRPTQDDARAALRDLENVFCDFPYRGPADRAGAIAAVLTTIARSGIPGNVPAFLFDASTPASGKGLQTDVVSILATGRIAEKRTLPENDDEELEKLLGACALRSASIVCFDDISQSCAFGGSPLNRVLTCEGKTTFRILGKTDDATLPWIATVLGSGNNIAFRGDAFRRVLMPRLEPAMENPEERTGFVHDDLRAWVRRERPRLVVAALTILRAYIVYGRPDAGTPRMGSFEGWSSLVPPAIVFAGGADPMGCRPAATGTHSEERSAIATVIEGWRRLQGETGLTVKGALDLLYSPGKSAAEQATDSFGDIREALEGMAGVQPGKRPRNLLIARKLGGWKNRPCCGWRLTIVGQTRTGVALWKAIEASAPLAPRTPSPTL